MFQFARVSCFRLRFRFRALSARPPMAVVPITDADRRKFLADNVSSDLQYVLEEAGVSLEAQYAIAQHYRSLRVFSTIADSKADVREALKNDFGIDPAANAAARASVAKVVTAWEVSRELSSKEQEMKAEAKVLGLPRNLQHSERQAMIKSVEIVLGSLQESETPSNEYLALKVEECENNEPLALGLDEVQSKFEATTSMLQSSLDTSGHVRVTKTKSKGKLPEDTESLRRVLKLEGITWLCMAAKFRNKSWLHGLELANCLKYIDFILGEKVNGLKVPVDGQSVPVKPPWNIVLTYEHRLRREAFKLVQSGENTLSEALALVVKNADLKESYFTTPIALSSSASSGHALKWQRTGDYEWKGKGKDKDGKGKKGKGKKGKGKGESKDQYGQTLVSSTPDGRELCYAFNAQGCSGKCGRVHACRVKGCYGNHAAREHQKYMKKDDEPKS